MSVSKYSYWQYRQLKNDELIEDAAGMLRAIVKVPVEYICECDEWRIQRVIDKLSDGVGIGTVPVFPAEDLVVNGELRLEEGNVYVIRT
jgi:hypothetical protein